MVGCDMFTPEKLLQTRKTAPPSVQNESFPLEARDPFKLNDLTTSQQYFRVLTSQKIIFRHFHP